MDVGAAGNAILFITLTVGQSFFSFLVLSYASHSLLVVVVDTAAGNDEVIWPDEPMVDWFWQFFYVAWLIGFWLVPAWSFFPATTEAMSFSKAFLLTGCTLWVVFPVSLLSSLSSSSKWAVIRPAILLAMVKNCGALLVYYITAGFLLAGSGGLLYFAVVLGHWFVMPVAAMACAATLLINGRLLGRLAWVVSFCGEPKGPVAATKLKPKKFKASSERNDRASDTSTTTEETKAPDETGRANGEIYGIAREISPATRPEAIILATPYTLAPPAETLAYEVPIFDAVELKTNPRTRVSTPKGKPKRGNQPSPGRHAAVRPLFQGIYIFPWYRSSLKSWVILSCGFFLMEALLLGQLVFFPF